jgi:hypothetical protein
LEEIMATAYTKELLIAVYLDRFIMGLPNLTIEKLEKMEADASRVYDEVGRDKFRERASVTPERIKQYRENYV